MGVVWCLVILFFYRLSSSISKLGYYILIDCWNWYTEKSFITKSNYRFSNIRSFFANAVRFDIKINVYIRKIFLNVYFLLLLYGLANFILIKFIFKAFSRLFINKSKILLLYLINQPIYIEVSIKKKSTYKISRKSAGIMPKKPLLK